MRRLLRLLSPSRTTRPWFALDVGSSAVKIAEVADRRGDPEVLRAGSLPVPPGAVENGFVGRPDVVGDAVRDFTARPGKKPGRAVVSIPGRGAIIKRLKVPAHPLEKLDQVIEFEAMDAIPEDLDAVNLDYHVLGAADGGAALEVLLVAARRALVESYVALLDAAGLVPAVVDVDYFALRAGALGSTAHALVHVGARSTTLHIPTAGPPGLTTDLPAGGEGFTGSLAESLRVSRDEAEALKRGDAPPELEGLLDSLCEGFAVEVSRGFSLLGGLEGGAGPRRIVLSGGGALLPGLSRCLARALDAEVRLYRPSFDAAPAAAAPAFAVVAGLATRSPSE